MTQGANLVAALPSLQPGSISFIGDVFQLCSVLDGRGGERCESSSINRKMLDDNRVLLDRFYNLQRQFTFLDEPVVLAQLNTDLLPLTRLAVVDAERLLGAGASAAAADILARNLAFWGRALGGKHALISDKVLQVGYSLSAGAISDLLWRHPALAKEKAIEEALEIPVSQTAMARQAILDREVATMRMAVDRESQGLARFFYKSNATLNGFHTCMKGYLDVHALGGGAYENAVTEFRQVGESNGFPGSLTNLWGRRILSSACPKGYWFDHINRGIDLEGKRRLVRLQLQLLATNVPRSKYAENASRSGMVDPVTNEPPAWDSDRSILFYRRKADCVSELLWVRLGSGRDIEQCGQCCNAGTKKIQ
jgi:hypothetical protein